MVDPAARYWLSEQPVARTRLARSGWAATLGYGTSYRVGYRLTEEYRGMGYILRVQLRYEVGV